MLTCTMGNIRVWRTCDPGARRPWIAGADAYLPYREQWQMIRWESYATPEERDRRYEDLIDGFRSQRYAPYYESEDNAHFAVIQQKSANVWLWRVYRRVMYDPYEQPSLYQRESRYYLFFADRVWSLPFEERPENWVELHEAAQNAHEMRLVERMLGATERELEDDQLFWRQYVEGAPAEAEAR